MADESIHSGHRERMRERFRQSFDLNGFSDHEVLEMLLYNIIPRADTAAAAHALLDTFGNLRTVLSADIDSLTAVKGIGLRCAEQLLFLGQVFLRAEKESFVSVHADDFDSLSRYLLNFFKGDTTERLCAFSINKAGRLTASAVLSAGITDRIAFDVDELKNFLAINSTDILILAHNHPGNSAIPSDEDVIFTRKLRNLLDDQVCFLDHLVVTNNEVTSMRALGFFRSFE